MFILDDGSDSGPLLIPQTSHSWLAWQVGSHWGNRRFTRPEPRAETLAAVLLHDFGWTEFERRPTVDAEGRPAAFDRMPVAAHLAIWEESIERAALAARFSGLLVAVHFAALAGFKEADVAATGDAAALDSVQAWRARMEERAAGWRRELAADPRFAQFLAGPRWEACRGVLAAADRIAVHLCAGWERPFGITVIGGDRAPAEVTATPLSGGRWRLAPWPLAGDRLTVHCEGRRPDAARFADAEELAAALAKAPVERAGFTLLRPSAVGKTS